ncbi:CLUMA_CG008833, isoform A [Clunio marinus]|uniref:CLUMA_CG008833, isoform A n=1 Tax=Clunio marinus TaxID=568069 RepID=A0A1J1I521_9DIPT|nr:CLUMA_CG008833, isoform A [Clunio marinus]
MYDKFLIKRKNVFGITLLLFISVNILQFSESAEIICDFHTTGFLMGGSIGSKNFYICLASLLKDEGIANITGINGEHSDSRTHSDVEAIRLTDDWLTEVPSGIDNFFPNIEFLYIRETQLKTVNSNQLQQFPNLEYLWLHKNQIETIEVNAFSRTPSLRVINLHTNKISLLAYNIFRPLHLEVLDMTGNNCGNELAVLPQTVNRLIAKIDVLCSPLRDIINEDLRLSSLEMIPTQNDLDKSIENFQDENKTLKDKVLDIEREVINLNLAEAIENSRNDIYIDYEVPKTFPGNLKKKSFSTRSKIIGTVIRKGEINM